MDVNPDTVSHVMRRHDVTRLIHGHTHRPAIHDLDIDGRPGQRFVLPEWTGEEWVLCWDAEGYRREKITSAG
jgi:UDP-2,3-diacylglucosamine hydrolase